MDVVVGLEVFSPPLPPRTRTLENIATGQFQIHTIYLQTLPPADTRI